MAYINDKKEVLKYIEHFREKGICMALICTASHWNTEAILYAAQKFAEKHSIQKIPVAIGITFNYKHMAQAKRVTYQGDARTGFISIMENLEILCGSSNSPYSRVVALPHLDHADPVMDEWALTEGTEYLASVMFDAQHYSVEENIKLISQYMGKYGDKVVVEGIVDSLAVQGKAERVVRSDYAENIKNYVDKTNVDLVVADLGTEQQSSSIGGCTYLKDRAQQITKLLGKSMLVLHGTSSLSRDQMSGLADDGIIRVNMWTRIAREAGQYAAEQMFKRARNIFAYGSFEDIESKKYREDSIVKAAEIIEDVLDLLGYQKLKE